MRKDFWIIARNAKNGYEYFVLRDRKNRKKAIDQILAKGLDPVAVLGRKEMISLSAAFNGESAVEWVNSNYRLFADDDVMDHVLWRQKWIEEWLKSQTLIQGKRQNRRFPLTENVKRRKSYERICTSAVHRCSLPY